MASPTPKPTFDPNATQQQEQKAASMRTAVFFVNATPFPGMLKLLEDFYAKNGDKMKIMFACNLDEFLRDPKTVPEKKEKPYGVRGLPSNTRVFDVVLGFKLVNGTKITDEESFKTAQQEVVDATIAMFTFASKNNIPLYFALQPRKDRPCNITTKIQAEAESLGPIDYWNENNVDKGLTAWILNNIVIPTYGSVENLADCINKFTSVKASYLADLYTLAMACIDDTHWTGYGLQSILPAVGDYLINGKGWLKKDINNVPYAKLQTTDGNQLFSLKSSEENKQLVLDKLKDLTGFTNKPEFTDICVVHDTLLNDIDDAPFMRWMQSFKTGGYTQVCNYDREHFQAARSWPGEKLNQTPFDNLGGNEADDRANMKDINTTITDAHKERLKKFIVGTVNEQTQLIVNPRICPKVKISAYHAGFKITGGVVDRETGYAVLLPEETRENAFGSFEDTKNERGDQTLSCYDDDGTQQFMICRNSVGNGGTICAQPGETGSKFKVQQNGEIKEEIKGAWGKPNGSMSEWHEFVIPLDTSAYWCNAIFFGSGPPGSKYDVVNTLDMLHRLDRIGVEWADARGIKKPFFGFHEFPHNSLFHLHMHCIDLDKIYDEAGEVLPAYLEHRKKTIALGTYIDKLNTQMLKETECAY